MPQMLSSIQSVFIGILMVVGSVAFLLILDLIWPRDERREHNDVVGWQVTVVGTTYAVIIGFMLFAVWTDFEAAQANAGAEANALVNISRLAEALPQARRDAIQATALQYATAMVNDEWPSMQRGEPSTASQILTERIWSEIVHPELDSRQTYSVAMDHIASELTSLTEHRRLRQLQSETGLPDILWAVLIAGAAITITSCCLFGAKSRALHLLQVLALSSLVALALMAVAQIDRPFQGDVHVEPTAFVHAEQSLRLHQP